MIITGDATRLLTWRNFQIRSLVTTVGLTGFEPATP
jgi:hypothetical protein